MSVYLLHLDTPLQHARHYIGWAKKVERRLSHHKNGTGARFTQVCCERGIAFDCVRVWEGKDRNFERRLKKFKGSKLLCPVCNPNALNRMKG